MSLRHDPISVIFIGLVLSVILAAAYFVITPQLNATTRVKIGDGIYTARRIVSHQPIESVSIATELAADKAVLRTYNYAALWSVDVTQRVALTDFIWLDEQKKVVHMVKNASKGSKPDAIFRNKIKAKYIIELTGGSIERKNIAITSTADFDDPVSGEEDK